MPTNLYRFIYKMHLLASWHLLQFFAFTILENLKLSPAQFSYYLFIYLHCNLHGHSVANRHSCSTSAEMRDRKWFSMQLILVISKMDMINHICHHFVESYCQLILQKKWLLSTLLSTVVTAMCACIRNTNVCFFPMYACMMQLYGAPAGHEKKLFFTIVICSNKLQFVQTNCNLFEQITICSNKL